MRKAIIVLACLLFIQSSFADELEVKRAMHLELKSSCPGNILHVLALASDDTPVPDVELRLIQYLPYQGLRALMHTNASGEARFELTKAATYRIDIKIENDTYNHEDSFEFNYTKTCPPPPPKQFNITLTPDCGSGALAIEILSGATPVEGALVMSPAWSTLSDDEGKTTIPFEDGFVMLSIEKTGYTPVNITTRVLCGGCLEDFDCADSERCESRKCVNVSVSGACGFASGHAWYPYQCCADAECGALGKGASCENNTCMAPQAPPYTPSNTSITENASEPIAEPNLTDANLSTGGNTETSPSSSCIGGIIGLSLLTCISIKNNLFKVFQP